MVAFSRKARARGNPKHDSCESHGDKLDMIVKGILGPQKAQNIWVPHANNH